MASISRPTWWSVCSRNPAYTSIWRASTGLSSSGMSSQAGISAWRAVSSASAGMTPSSFWRAKVRSRCASHPSSNWPAYLSAHSLGTWCGACVAPGREVHEERLVGHQRLLLAHPADRPIGEVLGQVVALLGGRRRLHRRRAVVQRRVPLVVLPADEPVERLEPAATRRPRIERTHRRRLPHRHLVALAELRRRVPVQLQRHRQRRLRVRPQRAVARRRRRRLGDDAHPDRMVVAARQQRRTRRRAQRRRVEAVVAQPTGGEPIRGRRADTARRTRSTHRSRRRRAARSARSARPPAAAAARSAGTPCPDPWRHRSSTPAPDDPGSATSCGHAGLGSSGSSVRSAGCDQRRRPQLAHQPTACRHPRQGDRDVAGVRASPGPRSSPRHLSGLRTRGARQLRRSAGRRAARGRTLRSAR